ncbi:MAG: hypothetical protein ACYTGH_08890 [Planctomycetota bacterium]|jgi:hypothetical protein
MEDLVFVEDEESGRIQSVTLYGEELLNPCEGGQRDLLVNGLPLKTRPHFREGNAESGTRLKGEHFVDHFSGWGLVVNRQIGARKNLNFGCTGINYLLRRELCDMDDLPCPGPGGPVNEAPLHVDSFGLLNWDWKFWGEKTRMIFPSSHTQGPCDEFGHIGYEHDTPANCKRFLQNVWRRTYPSTMVVHGGLFYNEETEHWIAITCRRAHVGYQLNIDESGDGVGYDFLLHAPFGIGDSLRMPEIKIYHGSSSEEMKRWLAWYTTFYYEECPEWVYRTNWHGGLAWDNEPTWTDQADLWEKELDQGLYNGIKYCLVTNRPIKSGTLPFGYEPDPNHGTISEFKAMARRLSDRGVPLLIWMSHSGLVPGADGIDDDWFIRGIDGRATAGWGSVDGGMVMCNPGHPGYIEYTKRWIHFYIVECGCKGIFFDCLGWVFPPDFTPRDFMRFPADTNRLTIKFQTEIYEFIKECDPEAILLGEGASLDAAINIFSIAGNPVRGIDGMGPRDFFLDLNRCAPKRMVVDQGGLNFPASGVCGVSRETIGEEHSRFLTRLVEEKGGRDAFTHLAGDLSIIDDLLFFPHQSEAPPNTEFFPARNVFQLPEPWADVVQLKGKFTDVVIDRDVEGFFHNVTTDVYEMKRG